jgi:hypothetical protein
MLAYKIKQRSKYETRVISNNTRERTSVMTYRKGILSRIANTKTCLTQSTQDEEMSFINFDLIGDAR